MDSTNQVGNQGDTGNTTPYVVESGMDSLYGTQQLPYTIKYKHGHQNSSGTMKMAESAVQQLNSESLSIRLEINEDKNEKGMEVIRSNIVSQLKKPDPREIDRSKEAMVHRDGPYSKLQAKLQKIIKK